MKIFILLGHPNKESFNGDIAASYQKTATAKGHEVRMQSLGDLEFDPILKEGYNKHQELELDLKLAQENILWCEKWVIVYPIWWGSVPALLKGFFDRTLLPKFAFKYHEKDPFWDKLLEGRSAEVITTSDAPWWWIRFQYGNSDINAVKKATLEFCGIKPVKVTRISGMRFISEVKKQNWISKIVKKIK